MQKELMIEDYQSAKDIIRNNVKELEDCVNLAKGDFKYFSEKLLQNPNDEEIERDFEMARNHLKFFKKQLKAFRIAQKLLKTKICNIVTEYRLDKEFDLWLNDFSKNKDDVQQDEIHDSSGWCDESDT